MAARQGAGAGKLEAAEVSAMFDRIASVYDLMNTAMTAGLHHRWRSRAAELARAHNGDSVLDVATGTGDLALELARRVGPGGTVLGSDFSNEMLERARAKGAASGLAVRPSFEWADAMALPYESGAFDAATVGFGARNFAQLDAGLREMVRVVRPGGRVVVLEITTPTRLPLSLFYRVWFNRLVPVLGRLLGLVLNGIARLRPGGAGDGGVALAYQYLPSSVRRFPGPQELARALEQAGLEQVQYELLAGGIVAIHAGTVPGDAA